MPGGYRELLEDLFAPLGGVSIRRMFGGLGIFREGMMFALVADEVLHFKADTETIPAFEKEGCGPWIYRRQGKAMQTSYWRAPERLFDEPEEFADWGRAAFAAAARGHAQKTAKSAKSVSKARSKPASKPARRRR